jgi:hypothetical protein
MGVGGLLATGGAENDLATAAQHNGIAQRAVNRDRFIIVFLVLLRSNTGYLTQIFVQQSHK